MRKLLDQAALQRPVDPLDAALRLAGVGAQDLDVGPGQRPAELRYALAALGVPLGHAEHRMPVGVEGDRASMGLEVALQGRELGERAPRAHEEQLHQPAARVVDEDQQGARVGAILVPAVLAAVDLHQLAQGLAAQPRLVEAPALLARDPSGRALGQRPGRERRAGIRIGRAYQLDSVVARAVRDPVVGRAAAGLAGERAAAAARR